MVNPITMDEELWPPARLLVSAEMPMPAEGDDIPALTLRMARGDDDAYREFYDRYFYRLLGYMVVLTHGDETAAKEALQLTLLRVVRYVKRFPDEEVFWSWLTVLARSALVDEQRKRLRHFGFLRRLFERRQIEQPPAEPLPGAPLTDLVPEALKSLSGSERDLIERKYFQGESVLEIAGALHLSEKAVESRLARAREKLRGIILHRVKYEA